jgi:hypothetical protein
MENETKFNSEDDPWAGLAGHMSIDAVLTNPIF